MTVRRVVIVVAIVLIALFVITSFLVACDGHGKGGPAQVGPMAPR